MKRTTLALDEDLLRQLKQRAAHQGTTLQSVANDLLRQALVTQPRPKFKLRMRGFDSKPQTGVDIADRKALFDLMDGIIK